jgi:MFS-type transporter involved in bile tolerance (Atg22 family)
MSQQDTPFNALPPRHIASSINQHRDNNNQTTTGNHNNVSTEGPSDQLQGMNNRKQLPLCFPRCWGRPVFDGNAEALAFGLDQTGRTIAYIGVAVFLGTALLQLATEAAGCPVGNLTGTNDIPHCDKRVYGVRPSSLLTTYAAIVGFVSSMSAPMIGAVIDFTPHRRLLGRILTAAYVLSLFPAIFVNIHTWFAVAVVQFVGIFIGSAQAAAAYAYLPDLTDNEDVLTGYTRAFTVLIFSSVVVYLAITVGFAWALGFKNDNVTMAKFGMSIAFVLSVFTETWSWWILFDKRPASRSLPPGKTLWTAGFEQISRTSVSIVHEYSALMWFFLSHSMSEAAILSLSSIAITFYTEELQMSATQNGIAAFVLLVSSIPGAFLSEWCTKRFNPIRSSIAALVILIGTTIIVAVVLTGPKLYFATFFLAAFWGIGVGWKLAADETVAACIIPEGQDAELMGFYLFSGEVFAWLPPLVFTVLNEAGVRQQYGVGCLSIFWLLSLIGLLLFGDYGEARERSNRMKPVAEIEASTMITRAEDGSNVATNEEDLIISSEDVVESSNESTKMLSPNKQVINGGNQQEGGIKESTNTV